ncbi:putative tRNA pseudouridine synthase Pus10 [Mortierella hygrophila]|uniref:tRNA pseudouridine(55) synthase n=1 Tax=Mortierella hygrophila TaxID=979708 RepID=A0A9P6FFN4_9FUNG|nr:putative tRNA pseudouridine synthase Pus10 [Mortierella hygrophila]
MAKHEAESLENVAKKLKHDMDTDQRPALKARLEEALSGGLKEITNTPGCVDVLFSIDCCGRCMLRFLGVRDFEIYELSSKEIKEILANYRQTLIAAAAAGEGEASTESRMDQEEREEKEEKEAICTACVGTVQFAEAFVQEIVERMQKEAYVTKTFNMNVTLPTSTLIRNHAVAIYWNQKLSSYPTSQVDIKEIFKLLISWPIERQTGLTLDFGSELRMQVAIKHEETKEDHVFLSTMKESGLIIKTKRENRKKIVVGDGRHHVVKALTLVKDHRFVSCGHVPPTPVSSRPQLDSIEMMRESVFVGGRYLKYTRDVSQTPWSIGTTMLAELSVSGIVCETLKSAFRADEFKFVTAGREDANVRMLGNGRPFYVEMINPRIPVLPSETIKQLEGEINTIMPDKVQIRHLASLRPEDTKVIKDGEETKTKSYSALCWTSKPVTQAMIDAVNEYNGKAFYVEQQTPIRVLQRRAQMIRKKEIHSLKAFPLEGHFMVVHLHTEAGTYIKEFVHGDLGRNQPSLASIIDCEADIMELDVLEVDLEFPPLECLP